MRYSPLIVICCVTFIVASHVTRAAPQGGGTAPGEDENDVELFVPRVEDTDTAASEEDAVKEEAVVETTTTTEAPEVKKNEEDGKYDPPLPPTPSEEGQEVKTEKPEKEEEKVFEYQPFRPFNPYDLLEKIAKEQEAEERRRAEILKTIIQTFRVGPGIQKPTDGQAEQGQSEGRPAGPDANGDRTDGIPFSPFLFGGAPNFGRPFFNLRPDMQPQGPPQGLVQDETANVVNVDNVDDDDVELIEPTSREPRTDDDEDRESGGEDPMVHVHHIHPMGPAAMPVDPMPMEPTDESNKDSEDTDEDDDRTIVVRLIPRRVFMSRRRPAMRRTIIISVRGLDAESTDQSETAVPGGDLEANPAEGGVVQIPQQQQQPSPQGQEGPYLIPGGGYPWINQGGLLRPSRPRMQPGSDSLAPVDVEEPQPFQPPYMNQFPGLISSFFNQQIPRGLFFPGQDPRGPGAGGPQEEGSSEGGMPSEGGDNPSDDPNPCTVETCLPVPLPPVQPRQPQPSPGFQFPNLFGGNAGGGFSPYSPFNPFGQFPTFQIFISHPKPEEQPPTEEQPTEMPPQEETTTTTTTEAPATEAPTSQPEGEEPPESGPDTEGEGESAEEGFDRSTGPAAEGEPEKRRR